MPVKDHLFCGKREFTDILTVIIGLSFLFSLTFTRFSSYNVELFSSFIVFLFFIFILLFGRLFLMKLYAYHQGFEIYFRQTYFNRFGLRSYDTLSHKVANNNFKGIPTMFVSFLLYILTFGIFIFPSIWNYSIKRIPYKHLGSYQRFEHRMSFSYTDITYFRYSKVLFLGFVYYLFVGLILKILMEGSELYLWFMATTFWIAFVSLIPIPGTEGYELFGKSKFAWISILPILVLGVLSILIFENPFVISLVAILSSIIIFMVVFWKRLMN